VHQLNIADRHKAGRSRVISVAPSPTSLLSLLRRVHW